MIKFSALGGNFLLVHVDRGRLLIGEGLLIREGELIPFKSNTSEYGMTI